MSSSALPSPWSHGAVLIRGKVTVKVVVLVHPVFVDERAAGPRDRRLRQIKFGFIEKRSGRIIEIEGGRRGEHGGLSIDD